MGRVKGSGERALLSPSHLPEGLLFLLSPIFLCHKIKDGGYNNTNMNKLLPTQNTPALQATFETDTTYSLKVQSNKLESRVKKD